MWIKVILNCLIALAFWLFVLYVRLFREFKDIIFSTKILTENKSLFAGLFFITFIVSIICLISLAIKYQKNFKPNETVKWIIEELHWVFYLFKKFEEAKKDLYTVIFSLFRNYAHYLLAITRWVLNHFFSTRLLLFAGIIIPRFIIISCLIAEIYLGHLKYFFYALLLLIIPLIIELLVFILKDIRNKLSYMIDEYVIDSEYPPKYVFGIYHYGAQDYYYTNSKYVFFKREYAYWDLDGFINNVYLPLFKIQHVMETDFLPLYNSIKAFSLFFYFFLQAICWGYIFFFLT